MSDLIEKVYDAIDLYSNVIEAGFNHEIAPVKYKAKRKYSLKISEIESDIKAKDAKIAELEEMLSVAEKLISTNMQVFEYLSGDNRKTMGAITEKIQAFDAYLVNHAYLTKGGK